MVYLPKVTIHTIFFITLIGFSVGSVGLWYLYVTSDTSVNGILLQTKVTWIGIILKYPSVLLLLCITVTLVLIVVVLLMIWLRVKINIAIKILYETSKCFRYILYFFAFPIIQFIIISACGIIFFDIMILIYSSVNGIPNRYNKSVNSTNYYVVFIMEIFLIFVLFWIMDLLIGACKMTVSVCAAIWYWKSNKTIIQRTIILSKVLKKVVSKALGSITKGSLFLSISEVISKLITLGLFTIDKNQDNAITFWLYFLKVIIFFVRKFIYSITNNSYVEISIYGGNFWKGAQKAFLLLMENSQRLLVVDTTTTILIMLIKIYMVILSLLISFFYIEKAKFEEINSIMPFVIGYYMLYGLAQQLMDPFYSINNAIFFCFCDDTVYNDGSSKKPYYMSYPLQLATRYINTKLTSVPYDKDKKNQHIFIEIDKRIMK